MPKIQYNKSVYPAERKFINKLKQVGKEYFGYHIGRRKSSTALVSLIPNGKGEMIINSTFGWHYFVNKGRGQCFFEARRPLELLGLQDNHDVVATVRGGGLRGQAGAISFGISRALATGYPEYRTRLRSAGLLTRDLRCKERKKFGLKKARKAPQFSKR